MSKFGITLIYLYRVCYELILRVIVLTEVKLYNFSICSIRYFLKLFQILNFTSLICSTFIVSILLRCSRCQIIFTFACLHIYNHHFRPIEMGRERKTIYRTKHSESWSLQCNLVSLLSIIFENLKYLLDITLK